MLDTSISPSSRWRFQTAMILSVAADTLQVFVFPLFTEGALSPADDIVDLAVAAILVRLLGWHWEFLPAFVGGACAGSGLGSVMDTGGCERLSQMKADGGH